MREAGVPFERRDHGELAVAHAHQDAETVEAGLLLFAHPLVGLRGEEVGVRVERAQHPVDGGVDQIAVAHVGAVFLVREVHQLGIELERVPGLVGHWRGPGRRKGRRARSARREEGDCCDAPGTSHGRKCTTGCRPCLTLPGRVGSMIGAKGDWKHYVRSRRSRIDLHPSPGPADLRAQEAARDRPHSRQGMSEFRKASNELTRSLNAELALDETPEPPMVRANRASQANQMDARAPRGPRTCATAGRPRRPPRPWLPRPIPSL